jgi:succinyl-diaminopimelate desuccinylase
MQGHVAYPERAHNPLPVLAACVTALKAVPLDVGTAHFPPTNLEFTTIDVGNTAGNVIPGKGTARFNVRFNDTWTPEKLDVWVRERLAVVDAGGCEILFEPAGRPSRCFLSPPGGGLQVLIDTIERATGTRPEQSTGGGTSDARFIADYCPVAEFGLPGPTMHKVDEHIRIADLEALTGLYAAFLDAYLA